MFCSSSCFHFTLLRAAQSKYIENTMTRSQTRKLTRKCPMTHSVNSGRLFLHNLVSQYTLPSSCHCPEIMIKDTLLSRSATHCDEWVDYSHLGTLFNAIFLLSAFSALCTHCISEITKRIKNFWWNLLLKTTRVWTICARVSKPPCLSKRWNS